VVNVDCNLVVLTWVYRYITQGGPESGALLPLPFQKGEAGGLPFHNRIVGNFMVYQDRIETYLLQLFAHPEISERFSIISVVIFEVKIVAEQKQAKLATIFCFL